LKAVKHFFEAGAVQASEGSSQTGHGHNGRPLLAEDVLGGCESAKCFGVLADSLQAEARVKVDGAEEVVQDAVRGHGRQVPLQNVQDNHFPLLEKIIIQIKLRSYSNSM
jgi:hypothetical protein